MTIEVLSEKDPRVLLLHAGNYDVMVQGEAATNYARNWLYSNDPTIHVIQHLSHAIAPSSPAVDATSQSYWTFTLDSDHTWNADSAGGYVPLPDADLNAPPQWGDDGLTTWDHLVAEIGTGVSDVGDVLGSGASSVWGSVPWYLKLALGLGLAAGAYKLVKDW